VEPLSVSEAVVEALPSTPDEILQRILYKDRLVMVINKPACVPVHPGPSGGPTVEDWFEVLALEHPRPPGLAHRLDRDTGGCLILGRSHKGLSRLGKLFEQRRIGKSYWAVVRGVPQGEQGVIDMPLAKVSAPGGWTIVADPDAGQSAVTEWQLMGTCDDKSLSWIEFRPKTGRTHQIRVHAQVLGCPLLGDPLYGSAADRAPAHNHLPPAQRPRLRVGPIPMHLLAREVTIPLYAERPALLISAPPPPHMWAALRACGWVQD
jgi:RluA family pseudouridine synthase